MFQNAISVASDSCQKKTKNYAIRFKMNEKIFIKLVSYFLTFFFNY